MCEHGELTNGAAYQRLDSPPHPSTFFNSNGIASWEEMSTGGPRIRRVELLEKGVPAMDALRVVRERVDETASEQYLSFGDIDAHAARLFLTDTPSSLLICDGKTQILPPRQALDASINDLRPSLHWRIDHPLDVLSFIIPRAALERWAEGVGARPTIGLFCEAELLSDEVIAGFGLAILPCFDRLEAVPQLFVDHVLNAVCGYLARTYGSGQPPVSHKGGLAAWQERRAKEMISENLNNQLSLRELADECRLSVSQFTKAFRDSIGQSPHQWLLERRIEQARKLLVMTELALSDVATSCGFADQSHFSRAFSKRTGQPPGTWRRLHMTFPIKNSPIGAAAA